MSQQFIEQAYEHLIGIIRQLGQDDLPADERARLSERAADFANAIAREYVRAQEQLNAAQRERDKPKRSKTSQANPPDLAHYRHILQAGGDADLIDRAMQHAKLNPLERIKILRTLFGYSVDEAKAVEARNQV